MIQRAALVIVALLAGSAAAAQTAPPLVDAMMSSDNLKLVAEVSRIIEDVCIPVAVEGSSPQKPTAAWLSEHRLVPYDLVGLPALYAEMRAMPDALWVAQPKGFERQLVVMINPGPRCRILVRQTPQVRALETSLGIELGQNANWLTLRVRPSDAMFVRRDPGTTKRVAAIEHLSDGPGLDNSLQASITVAPVPESVIKH